MLSTLFCSIVLALQQGAAASTQDVRDAVRPFGHELVLSLGERLRSYAWDDGASVPYFKRDALVRIDFGERGLASDARLYLPGSDMLESLASGAQNLDLRALETSAGRFGLALRFAPNSLLRVALPSQDPATNGWTLSFWVRPESGALGRSLVLLPNAVELVLLSDRHLRAALLPSGAQLIHPHALALDHWNYVSFSYDPGLQGQAALFVNDRAVNANFATPAAPRLAAELWAGDLALSGRGFAGSLDELTLVPGATSTARALRASRGAATPGSHALELTTTLGKRRVEPAAQATREMWLDSAADFEPGELAGVVAAGGGLRWAPARWSELGTAHAPPPRTTHPLVALGGRRMFTYGGETRDTHLGPMFNTSDTWLFDGGDWTQVAAGTGPSPRCHIPAEYSPDHDLVLLVGGWKNGVQPFAVYQDTWVFHVASRTWEQRFPSGPALGPVSDHGLVYLPTLRKFLMLRNRANWLYDPVADAWQALAQTSARDQFGQPVSYSIGASTACELDPRTGLVVCFGGSYGNPQTFSDTTALYDVTTNAYTVLATSAQPSPRVRAAFTYDPRGERFVLFGGVQDQYSQRHDDLWVFDSRTLQWRELECSNRPSPRGGYYGLAYDELGARFLLYGGRETPVLWNDQTLALELDDQRPGTALYTFDRLQDWARSRWQADVVAPGGSSVAFRFRISDWASEWSAWSATPSFGRARFVQVEATLSPGPLGEVPAIQRMGLR
ncbi:MAG: hypothetical protein EXS08_13345 [Planctomycetes bacterium]|nr:hypothetical protein [Planctomycetota bacterium]